MQRKFKQRMHAKGHAAELEFRHGGGTKGHSHPDASHLQPDEGEIHVHVITDATARGQTALSAKEHGLSAGALSGGEKSITSLILLAAIADAADPPFRIVDEFDVYQDETSRKASMKALQEDALVKGADGLFRQHILLTPHDVSSAVKLGSEDVKVFKMSDPKRKD
jgi:hypothetical protein